MEGQTQVLRPAGLGERIRLAIDLTKKHGLKVFLVTIAVNVVFALIGSVGMMVLGVSPALMAGAMGSGGATAGMMGVGGIIMMVLFCLVLAVALFFIYIGIYTLVLRYSRGENGVDVTGAVLSPFKRFVPILVAVILFDIAATIVLGVVSLINVIPVLGQLIFFFFLIVYYMVSVCFLFCLADSEMLNPIDCLVKPVRMVFGALSSWFLAGLVSILAFIPASLVMFLGALSAASSTVLAMILMLLGVGLMTATMVWAVFLAGVTYLDAKRLEAATRA